MCPQRNPETREGQIRHMRLHQIFIFIQPFLSLKHAKLWKQVGDNNFRLFRENILIFYFKKALLDNNLMIDSNAEFSQSTLYSCIE